MNCLPAYSASPSVLKASRTPWRAYETDLATYAYTKSPCLTSNHGCQHVPSFLNVGSHPSLRAAVMIRSFR